MKARTVSTTHAKMGGNEAPGHRLWRLYVAVLLFVAAGSLQGTVVAFRLSLDGAGLGHAGQMVAAYFAGLLLGAYGAPAAVHRLGHVPAFIASACLSALALAAFTLTEDIPMWGMLQFATGLSIACQYVVVESWFNIRAHDARRARLFGFYMICWFVGAGVGPLLMNLPGMDGPGAFYTMAAMMLASALPFLVSHTGPGGEVAMRQMPLGPVYRASRLGFLGTFVVGLSFGAVFGLTAAFANGLGWSEFEVTFFAMLFILGGGVCQYPVGHLSDTLGRRAVLLACALVAALSAAAFMIPLPKAVLFALAFVFGGASLPLYALSVALVHDGLEEKDRVAASGGLLLLNAKGSIVGPLLVGWVAAFWGPGALFAILALAHLVLALAGFRHSPGVSADSKPMGD